MKNSYTQKKKLRLSEPQHGLQLYCHETNGNSILMNMNVILSEVFLSLNTLFNDIHLLLPDTPWHWSNRLMIQSLWEGIDSLSYI